MILNFIFFSPTRFAALSSLVSDLIATLMYRAGYFFVLSRGRAAAEIFTAHCWMQKVSSIIFADAHIAGLSYGIYMHIKIYIYCIL